MSNLIIGGRRTTKCWWDKKLPKTALAIGLAGLIYLPVGLSPPASAQSLADLSDADRSILWDEFRNYLLNHPEILIELSEILQQQQAAKEAMDDAEAIAANMDALFNDPNSWQGGNPDGDVTIVEFIDYRCGYCREAHPVIETLLGSDPNIRLIVKEFPILTEESLESAKLALAVLRTSGPDAYKKVHDFLIRYDGPIDGDVIKDSAELAAVDQALLSDIAQSASVQEIINANYQLARTLSIKGTPAFVIGENLLRGYLPLDRMQALIKEERKQQ